MRSIAFSVKPGESDLNVQSGTIHHNGDWCGDVIFAFWDGKKTIETKIPAVAVRRAAAHIISSALVNEAERMGDRIYTQIIDGKF